MSRLPKRDLAEQVVLMGDTINLNFTAVEFVNYTFDTIFFDVCKRYKFASYPVFMHSSVSYYDSSKELVSKDLIYTACASPLETVKLAKGEKRNIFVELPNFDIKGDSTEAIWGIKFSYMVHNFNVMVDSAGQHIQKIINVSSDEQGFLDKAAFDRLPGYSYKW